MNIHDTGLRRSLSVAFGIEDVRCIYSDLEFQATVEQAETLESSLESIVDIAVLVLKRAGGPLPEA